MKTASFIKFASSVALLFAFAGSISAQVFIGSTGVASTESFTVGTSAAATLPTGWRADTNSTVRTVGVYSSAGTATARAGAASISSSAGNGIYNYGSTAGDGSDRAIGFLSSSSASKSGNLYVQLQNNTGSTVSNWTISYDVEKYRSGSNSAGFSIQMYYSTNGSSWTSAGAGFLTSFSADADNNGYTTTPSVTSSITASALNLSVASGSSLYLAWNYSVTSGTTTSNAQGLGIDNFSVTAVPEPSTYAAIAGVLALGGVMWQRRRQRAAAPKA